MVFENQLLVNELLDPYQKDRIIDLKRIVPIGRIDKNGAASLWISLNGIDYVEIQGDYANDETARFIKINNLSHMSVLVSVYVGEGYVAIPNRYWSDCFKRYDGWTGADGIYSFNITNGKDYYNNMTDTKTLFFFGDTLISKVDRETLHREKPIYMPNNTYAILDGEDPQSPGALQFYYDTDEKGNPTAVIKPSRDCFDFEEKGEDFHKAYFWFQDGVVLGNKLYSMPSIITEDKTGPEGFQFRCIGVTIAETNIIDGVPDFKGVIQHKADLFAKNENFELIYGACIMPNIEEAGYRDPDGYVYVYGHITFKDTGRRSLCVARVLPDEFVDWTKWRFYDGENFVDNILESKPLLDHISCEMSVIPIAVGKNAGKYLAVFQYDTQSNYTAYAIGETPWGPFSKPSKVYYCDEDKIHETVYMYNAKAHPHLSYAHRILISYNVNSTSPVPTYEHGHLYRPRFIQLEDTTVDPMTRLFDDAFDMRVEWFRTLNKSVIPGGTVFVGDSITQEFLLEEMLKGYMPIYNRGIGADTTTGLLKRLDESIFDLEPSKLFLMMGTNDLALDNGNVDQVVTNLSVVIEKVNEKLPECKIHLVSILPINNTEHPKINHDAVYNRSNKMIQRTNRLLMELSSQKQVIYVDLYSKLLDKKGNLAIPYTREGLHISPKGYEVIAQVLKNYL